MVLLECLFRLKYFGSFLVSQDDSLRSALNSIFWLSCLFGIVFLYFQRLLKGLLRLGRLQRRNFAQIAQYLWNICFNTTAMLFLTLYRVLLIRPEDASNKYFPQYHNVIFASSCDAGKFEVITLVLVAFEVVTMVLHLSKCDYSEAFSNALYGALLMSCLTLRLETYSMLLSFYVAMYRTCRELLLLCSSQMDAAASKQLTFLVAVKICTWCYLFLNLLPFEFLIPTLNARKDHFSLKVWFGLWYCSCIWNSPLLKLLYHKIYHTYPYDCAGGASAVRCILSADWERFRHFRNLEHAFCELKLHLSKKNVHPAHTNDSTNAQATAFQTIKCVVALKRKLKRLRENRELQRLKDE